VAYLGAALFMVGKAIVVVVLAIWFAASFAGAYLALYVFWPLLSLGFVIACGIAWSVRRFSGGADVSRESAVATVRRSSVPRARPFWEKPAYVLLCAPFVLQSPMAIAWELLRLAAQEEPHVVVGWSWLGSGALLIAGFAMSVIATRALVPRD
jgi:hypothetical protein